ncbi:U3 small nucleolar RNA-associated protein 14 homolog A-like isoform X1 [Mya arenaria]|uniref:U3 small nucleolar RNA-associated protein 14 homolog A-like isoform X1 n=1 Tax=Mya arenaria TaxID=6604 RepID=UPI0022E6249C|nr:U3 small nucleolar RNA-associated protein 14 homolog A-like isoform X1 [Mya arenaria]
MEAEDGGEVLSSDDETILDERKHNQLLDAITSIDGKKKNRLSQRTVISNQISEFNFTSSKDDSSKVRLHELVGSLKETGSHDNLKKQLSTVQRHNKTVATPLPRHEKEKINRTAAYEATTQEVSKWDPLVRENRKADQLYFPLQKQDFSVVTTDQLVKRFQPRTPLEMQVAALLRGSENVVQDAEQCELTPAEQRALRAMDLQEAKERRMELMKHRALMSYKELRAKRQKKIKSKRFHRILKKEKLKTEKKLLETLQQDDPESFLEKINQFEKERAEERMSLKHRGGTKFAKRQMIYAKFDDRARQEVQNMLQKSREITQKLKSAESSDDSADEIDDNLANQTGGDAHYSAPGSREASNPWMVKPTVTIKLKSDYARPETVENEVSQQDDIHSADVGDDFESESKLVEGNVNEIHASGSEHDISDGDNDDGDESESDMPKESRKSVKKANVEIVKEGINKHSFDDVNEDEEDISDDIDEIFNKKKTKTKVVDKVKQEVRKKTKEKKKKKEDNKNGVTKLSVNKRKKEKRKKELERQNRELRKQMERKTDEARKRKVGVENSSDIDNDIEEDNDSGEEVIDEKLVRKRTLAEIENDSEDEIEPEYPRNKPTDAKKARSENKKSDKPTEAYIDPNKLFTMSTRMKQVGSAPDLIDDGETELDPEEQQRLTIAQAFADDDVIDEFSQEKDALADAGKPQDICLHMPGWGEWGGDGVKVNRRKRKRLTIKAPPPLPRKDQHLGHVIISEKKNEAVKKHQVSEVPFPYTSADQFEKSIRAPLGKTWNPEMVYKQMVKPKVVTQMGKIISPMDKSEAFANRKEEVKGDLDGDKEKKFGKSKMKDNKKHKGKGKRK